MNRLLLPLALFALIFGYHKYLVKVPRQVRAQRLAWLAYSAFFAVLALLVVRTGSLSTGVVGALLLASARSVPAIAKWLNGVLRGKGSPSASEQRTSDSAPPKPTMSRSEALQILELSGDPSQEQVIRRYRELMLHVHPDHGGSNYFAAKLNEARRVLLAEPRP